MLSHKTGLSKFKKIRIIQSIFFEHSEAKLAVINTKDMKKSSFVWEVSNRLMEKNSSLAMGLCDVICDKEDILIHHERINHSVSSAETIGENAKATN